MDINPETDLQIWNNAAFDIGESGDPTMPDVEFSPSLSKSKPSFLDLLDSLESDSPTKENQNPSSIPSPVSLKPLHSNAALKNMQLNAPRLISRHDDNHPRKISFSSERNIDLEIEEIEREIERLSSRLESLRLEKAQRNAKLMEKRGRVVASKFMEVKEKSGQEWDGLLGTVTGRPKTLNPIKELETVSGRMKTLNPVLGRRGVSLGPAEIYSETKLRQLGKQEMVTPIQQAQNRRKSCFWKLGEIDEVNAIKQRGKSLSPKSRKSAMKLPAWKSGAVTTVGSKKFMKKEDGIASSLIKPKNLFKDGDKSAPIAKKPLKNGRVVASRYSQTNGVSAMKGDKKRALTENDKEEAKKCEKKRVSLAGKLSDNGVKWPTEAMSGASTLVENTPVSVTKMLELVPNIRTRHCMNDSPRDSGAAKRVSELIGRRSYFSMNVEELEGLEGPSVCQALGFDEEYAEKSYPTMINTSCCIDESLDDSSDDDDDWKNCIFQALRYA